MRSEALKCWRCGESLAAVLLPIGHYAECPACEADLHVCRQCRFYDARMIGRCTHDRADRVEVKERANYCEHFRPSPRAHAGTPEVDDRETRQALDALFETPASDPDAGPRDTDEARRELDALFGLDPDDASSDPPTKAG